VLAAALLMVPPSVLPVAMPSAPLAETPSVPAVGTLAPSVPAAQPGPPVTFAERAPLASRSLLLAIAPAGQRLVAVGERGHILLSDDQGQTWSQAESVPTRSLLTGVCFGNDGQGVAVGHDEVILTTGMPGGPGCCSLCPGKRSSSARRGLWQPTAMSLQWVRTVFTSAAGWWGKLEGE